jgi:hypothetical protein
VKLDDAKDAISKAALQALENLFLMEFNGHITDSPKADDHMEKGFGILLETEAKALEIASRLVKE